IARILGSPPFRTVVDAEITTLTGSKNGITSRLRQRVGATRRPAQHFAVLRFLPTAPFFWTFSMYAGAYGTLHDVSPTSTDTVPIFWAVCRARSVSGCT